MPAPLPPRPPSNEEWWCRHCHNKAHDTDEQVRRHHEPGGIPSVKQLSRGSNGRARRGGRAPRQAGAGRRCPPAFRHHSRAASPRMPPWHGGAACCTLTQYSHPIAQCKQDWQRKHELDRKAIQELVCALCATRQPVGTACTACGVEFGAPAEEGGSALLLFCRLCLLCTSGAVRPAVRPSPATCTTPRPGPAAASAHRPPLADSHACRRSRPAGAYSCLTCRFFDDELAKQPYHCEQVGAAAAGAHPHVGCTPTPTYLPLLGSNPSRVEPTSSKRPLNRSLPRPPQCGICRIGGRDNYFHCATCGSCYSMALQVQACCV